MVEKRRYSFGKIFGGNQHKISEMHGVAQQADLLWQVVYLSGPQLCRRHHRNEALVTSRCPLHPWTLVLQKTLALQLPFVPSFSSWEPQDRAAIHLDYANQWLEYSNLEMRCFTTARSMHARKLLAQRM